MVKDYNLSFTKAFNYDYKWLIWIWIYYFISKFKNQSKVFYYII